MAIAIKIQVIHAPAITEGKRQDGSTYYQRALQCFIDEAVAVHTIYADKKEDLEKYGAGYYMAQLTQRPGDRARAGFIVGELTPVTQQAKPN